MSALLVAAAVGPSSEVYSVAEAQLSERWTAAVGAPPPRGLTGKMLAGALAYEEQCKLHGGLPLTVRKQLDSIARSSKLEHLPDSKGTVTGSKAPASGRPNAQGPLRQYRPKRVLAGSEYGAGTRFVRDWKGVRHTTTVAEGGFEWDGTVYTSLSAIARAITGTHWNGRRFFGLDKAKS